MARQSSSRGGGRPPKKQARRPSKPGPPRKAGGARPGPRAAGPGRAVAAPRAEVGKDREPGHAGPGGKADRLQKVLAHAGLGSRRECEDYILQGRVTVDGKVVRELGTRVDPEQSTIAVDGERIKLERMVYYAVNKPRGYVSTNDDPAGRPRVVDLLPEVPERVYSVGRLDEDSTGLMILTNDGELANRLAHPRYGVEKTYRALVAGSPPPEVIRKLSEGIWLSEGKVRAKRARVVGSQGEATLLELVLAEGKKREIRRMLAKLGHKVMSLTRIAIGPVVLKGLGAGEHRPLSRTEIELLRKVAAGIEVSPPRFLAREGSEARGHGRRPPRAPKRSAEGPPGREGPQDRAPRRPGRAGDRERTHREQSGGDRPHRDRPPRPARPADGTQAKRVPGKPPAGRPLPGKPLPGKPVPGRSPESGGPVESGKKLTGGPPGPKRVPAASPPEGQPRPPRKPMPGAGVRKEKPAEEGPRRRIIGLTPRVAEQAGITLSGKPPRKRPIIRKRPPRRVFGIRRPDEGGGDDES